MNAVPDIRIQMCHDAPVNAAGDFVLYWMIANRRVRWNFSLQRAVEWAQELNKPLVILEALRVDYPWASDRLHRFVMDGMAEKARRLASTGVLYYPYVEPARDAGKGLLETLAARACVMVTDDFPCFFLPRMVASVARKIPTRLEKIDSNGLLPLRAATDVYPTAYAFRRFLQRNLHPYMHAFPLANPLAEANLPSLKELPEEIVRRWPRALPELLEGDEMALAMLPINHRVKVTDTRGGELVAQAALTRFLNERLVHYGESRNEPEHDVTSGLSPYLHFGFISVHEVFDELMCRENGSIDNLPLNGNGSRQGWWPVGEAAEAFLDELITWRELGYNMCWQRDDYDCYDSLPDWAQATLAKHVNDHRPYVYTVEAFEAGRTHDPLWNAAQMQLVREGRIHNYLRMLWGKKILEWSATPQDALAVMIELNNKYGLDGRNPNSYSGIFWCLGRYDRPWGPERPVFGTVRYMSSENTARKVRVKNYIQTYAP
jgi:deoxyribodipyrimidine photo-lyase